jgi:ParB-like chromosome segregation protein Spo0J
MSLTDSLRNARARGADPTKPADDAKPKLEFPKLEFHPIANIFPMLDEQSPGFLALVEDIKERGLDESIVLYEGKILDGRNRYRACELAGRIPRTRDYPGRDPVGFVLAANLHRRHLNEAQRALVAAKLANLELGANQQSEGVSIDIAAELLNISRSSVARAKVILTKGDPSLVEAVQQGEVSLAAGAEQAQEQADAGDGKGKGKGKGKGQSTPGSKYDGAEKRLLEKLEAFDAKEAAEHSSITIKKLKQAVAAKATALAALARPESIRPVRFLWRFTPIKLVKLIKLIKVMN